MSDLKKPLGQKVPKESKREKSVGTTSLLTLAAMFIATAALGFVIYDRINPTNPAPQAGGNIEFSEGEKTILRNSKTITSSKTEPKPVERLQEIKPEGNLTVPTVTPTPSPRVIGQKSGATHLPEKELSEKTANGILPKIAADGRRPMDVYAREPDTDGNFGVARVVIVVASLGISQSSSQEAIKKLPPSVTLAFAPYGNSLKRWMQLARKQGHELLLQLPMEPIGQANPGPHTLTTSASNKQNIDNLHWSMARITNYVGVMNFLGGKFTSDPTSLKPIFDELSQRGLLYLDDGTTGNKSMETATASLLPFAQAHIHIDSVRTRKHIANRLNELTKLAKRKGLAIGFANAFPETISMLADYAAKASKNEIEITPISSVVKDPQRSR